MKIWQNENIIPIKSWINNIDSECLRQANNLANLPFAFHHIALMPDCHSGYGMPIGGVLATKEVIIPNAVGVDIGCGLIAAKTSAEGLTLDEIKKILGKVREIVPVGFNHHKKQQEDSVFNKAPVHLEIIKQELQSAKCQLGTLGGGNHFIEIQKGEDGFIWLMIHSGSRNLGKKIAEHFTRKAIELNKKWKVDIPKAWDLAFLPVGTQEGQDYIEAMQFCLEFANANRVAMMDRVIRIFTQMTGHTKIDQINVHHNYAAVEEHFNENVWVHRKGAIRMEKGERGIIPGSMGTPSYIVEGLGNEDSFCSASHGAGRKMSRKQANQVITESMAQEALKGIVYGRFNGKYDECPQAYKDIDEVIKCEMDLIKPIVRLTPLGVIKG